MNTITCQITKTVFQFVHTTKATPLQIAMVSAGLANNGVVMNPRMVDAVIGNDLSTIRSFDNTEFGQAVDATVADQVTAAMVASVATGAAQVQE